MQPIHAYCQLENSLSSPFSFFPGLFVQGGLIHSHLHGGPFPSLLSPHLLLHPSLPSPPPLHSFCMLFACHALPSSLLPVCLLLFIAAFTTVAFYYPIVSSPQCGWHGLGHFSFLFFFPFLFAGGGLGRKDGGWRGTGLHGEGKTAYAICLPLPACLLYSSPTLPFPACSMCACLMPCSVLPSLAFYAIQVATFFFSPHFLCCGRHLYPLYAAFPSSLTLYVLCIYPYPSLPSLPWEVSKLTFSVMPTMPATTSFLPAFWSGDRRTNICYVVFFLFFPFCVSSLFS